ncbi:predicted protein [Nematostella vectensis]|uniref:Lamin n=1 Tax=Nematostella vectensis TaxID=45351 RepID=A7SGD1_NEMVE|nr:lamin-L(I) [Nematostella vectensis]EDO37225.1 predicted protein [Nematostella vectensis]|eukprot:XP_001629288.1 predicted protein [Nematostella vectensis]
MATATKSPASSSSTPKTPVSSSRIMGSSPPGSAKFTRAQEKAELQHLNDRLATYIDRVKNLEQENSKLRSEVTVSRKTVEREVDSMKSLYETELADARRLLDETAKEKAKQQIESSKNSNDAQEFKNKFDKEAAARKKAEKELNDVRKLLHDKENQLTRRNQEALNLESVLRELQGECEELKDALKAAKYALEQETLTRVDLENRCQSLQEEQNFKKQMYDKELSDIRSQLKTVETKRVVVETDYKDKYEGLMAEKLQELREDYDSDARSFKEETELLYSSKFEELRIQRERDSEALAKLREENRNLSKSVDELSSQVHQLEAKNNALVSRVSDLQGLRAQDKEKHDNEILLRENEIAELRTSIDDALRDYEDLMGVKVALDMEITAYRKLLESEETRLEITPPASPVLGGSSSVSQTRRGNKRARTEETESTMTTTTTAEGAIQFTEADPDGKYIKIYNSGEKDEALGGWTIQRQVGTEDPSVYKFTPKYVLKSQSHVTVWSAQGGGTHKPPSDLVFKQLPSWGSGNEARTALVNAGGEEMATLLEEKVFQHYSTDVIDSGRRGRGRRDGEVAKGCAVM